MKEIEILNIINNSLNDNTLLGEDCAFLKDLGLFITQDTLCEGVHFDLKYTDFYTLAQKSVAVNLSDLAANLAKPKYISISLSFPSFIKNNEIENFYRGINDSCNKYNIVVTGGDLTGSKSDIVISICAIGVPYKKNQPVVSRGYAKENQVICVTKNYGSSAYALNCLQNNKKCSDEILKAHLSPKPDIDISEKLANLNCKKIAVMDSSDGLCDALFKMAKASDKLFEIDFNKIPEDLVEEFDDEFAKFKNLLPHNSVVIWLSFMLEVAKILDNLAFKKLKFEFSNHALKIHGTNGSLMVQESIKKLQKPVEFELILV